MNTQLLYHDADDDLGIDVVVNVVAVVLIADAKNKCMPIMVHQISTRTLMHIAIDRSDRSHLVL